VQASSAVQVLSRRSSLKHMRAELFRLYAALWYHITRHNATHFRKSDRTHTHTPSYRISAYEFMMHTPLRRESDPVLRACEKHTRITITVLHDAAAAPASFLRAGGAAIVLQREARQGRVLQCSRVPRYAVSAAAV